MRLKGAAFPHLRAHQRRKVARGQALGRLRLVVVLLQLVLPESHGDVETGALELEDLGRSMKIYEDQNIMIYEDLGRSVKIYEDL